MERIKVEVSLPAGKLTMDLIDFIVYPDPKNGPEILAICIDEGGHFDTYGLADLKALAK